jgi:3-deoxy-D-manno-octulosonic-acid transferase
MRQLIWQWAYAWFAVPVMQLGLWVAARRNRNLRQGLEGRRGLWQRLDEQLRQRDAQTPLIWFHVASAGEFLQAQPVLERCLAEGYECAVTATSVNGCVWMQRAKFHADRRPVVMDYLPLDSAGNMRRILRVLQPACIVYVKYDLWPNLVWQAYKAGIPQYLICAALRPGSRRTRSALARSLYRTVYPCLSGIFTITDDDRQRFLTTCPEHPNVHTAGDTKYDSVLARKRALPPPAFPAYAGERFVVIVGSSWPADETCIGPALREALGRCPDLLLVVVPHEPTEEHLAHSAACFQGLRIERLTQLAPQPAEPPHVILGDTVGILSSLYAIGSLAYVGGGFTTGVHNVTEPAVMGLPVICGPRCDASPEAAELLQQGVAFSISTPQEFRAALFRFLDNREECRQIGQRAERLIEARAGASARCFALVTANLTARDDTVLSIIQDKVLADCGPNGAAGVWRRASSSGAK